MALLWAVTCYFALFASAIFNVTKKAFCSSNVLYDLEQSHGLRETFALVLPPNKWNWASIIAHVANSAPASPIGDIETCPGPIDRCVSCSKALKKHQSSMACSQRHLKLHLKCFCPNDSGVSCSSCLFNNNTQDGADHDQQEDVHRHDIPELSQLVSKKGLKMLNNKKASIGNFSFDLVYSYPIWFMLKIKRMFLGGYSMVS